MYFLSESPGHHHLLYFDLPLQLCDPSFFWTKLEDVLRDLSYFIYLSLGPNEGHAKEMDKEFGLLLIKQKDFLWT